MKRYKQKILGRVLRVWIAKNPKRNNEIISLNFLILDEKNETIVGSINNKYIQQFEEYFVEGNILLITDFEVWKTTENYKISNHRFQLRINDQSTIEIINDAE
ncbi:hypothetical protein IGI04_026646, partial [Brassica rapa subsp. trilocularis]